MSLADVVGHPPCGRDGPAAPRVTMGSAHMWSRQSVETRRTVLCLCLELSGCAGSSPVYNRLRILLEQTERLNSE